MHHLVILRRSSSTSSSSNVVVVVLVVAPRSLLLIPHAFLISSLTFFDTASFILVYLSELVFIARLTQAPI